MAKKKEKAKNPPNRPRSKIDWLLVGRMAVAGCMCTWIAAKFGIRDKTLARRFMEDIEPFLPESYDTFGQYLTSKRSSGKADLKLAQWEEALQERDRTMLVWLGKNELGQTDKKEIIQDKTPVTFVLKRASEKKKDNE